MHAVYLVGHRRWAEYPVAHYSLRPQRDLGITPWRCVSRTSGTVVLSREFAPCCPGWQNEANGLRTPHSTDVGSFLICSTLNVRCFELQQLRRACVRALLWRRQRAGGKLGWEIMGKAGHAVRRCTSPRRGTTFRRVPLTPSRYLVT